jgi:hypothetical protein
MQIHQSLPNLNSPIVLKSWVYLTLQFQPPIPHRLLVYHLHQPVIVLHINPTRNQFHRPLKIRRFQPVYNQHSPQKRGVQGGDLLGHGEGRGPWHVTLRAHRRRA